MLFWAALEPFGEHLDLIHALSGIPYTSLQSIALTGSLRSL